MTFKWTHNAEGPKLNTFRTAPEHQRIVPINPLHQSIKVLNPIAST